MFQTHTTAIAIAKRSRNQASSGITGRGCHTILPAASCRESQTVFIRLARRKLGVSKVKPASIDGNIGSIS